MSTRTARPLAMRAYRTGMRTLAALTPRRAERVLARRFLTPTARRPEAPAVVGIPVTRREVRSAGENLVVWQWGAGPDVLLAHGWESSAATWADLVPPLVAAGYRVTAPDLPAHGASTGLRTHALQMAECLVDLARGLDPAGVHAVVGHSAGGTAVALALEAGLPAERAVLLAPAAQPALYLLDLAHALGLSRETALGALPVLDEEAGAPLDRLDAAQAVRGLRIPGLVVHDRDDRRVDPREGQRIADAWPGCLFLSTRGLGHSIQRAPSVVDAVLGFVAARSRAIA